MPERPVHAPEPTPQTSCIRTLSTRALLLALAPATLAAAPLEATAPLGDYRWVPSLLLSGVLALAGLRHHEGALWTRIGASLSFLTWVGGTVLAHHNNPARGFVVLLGAVAFLTFLWPSERLRRLAMEERSDHPDQELLLASGVAALFGFDEWQLNAIPSAVESLALSLAYAVPLALAWSRQRPRGRWWSVALAISSLTALLPAVEVVAGLLGQQLLVVPLGLLSPLVIFSVFAARALLRWSAPEEPGLLDAVFAQPARVLVLSFVAICAAGTLLLGLPVASASGQPLSWLDAAFTAVSATCVTGLSVVDTPNTFGALGQLMVLILIQVGGLGIMVFSAAAVVLLGGRLSLSHERAAVDLVGATGRAGLVRSLRDVFLVTLGTEAGGALLLFLGFLGRGDDVATAAWRGIFTSISAFCNAGFALQSDSLVSYADSPYVLSVIGLVIILGSLGPAVVMALGAWRDPARRTLHARLVLWSSALLVLVPALLITGFEWSHTLDQMPVVDRLANGIFQSVTLRTAGFNSIDLSQVQPATWTVMILTMFVGGSPGSTAGGVKTTTIAVILLAIAAVVRGRARVEVFGRALPVASIVRATAVATLGVLGCCVVLVAIQLTQPIALDVALFEVVSALATVGLSTGGTGQLDEVGKVIIMACMFAGRVGPLTLFVFLASNAQDQRTRHRYPEEPVSIG